MERQRELKALSITTLLMVALCIGIGCGIGIAVGNRLSGPIECPAYHETQQPQTEERVALV